MRIAVAGKGGTGKTTIAGTLARVMAQRGREVWAIDADSNPNLAITLGVSRDAAIEPVPRSILRNAIDESGKRQVTLGIPAIEVMTRHGYAVSPQIKLLLMGRVDHAGAG